MSEEITEYSYYEKIWMGKVNAIEVVAVFIISFLILRFTSLVDFFTSRSPYGSEQISYLSVFFVSIGITIVPVVYVILNGISPIQDAVVNVTRFKPIDISKFLSPPGIKQNSIAYMAHLCKDSVALSNAIFKRGIVYLLLGVLFAIGGVLFFYMQVSIAKAQPDFKTELLHYAPKFGILFFIELISFYFLKQYRSTMDEFRYYEGIKRSREENFLMLKLVIERSEPEEILNNIERFNLRSNVDKLNEGQTLDLLEARKLEKGELDVLVKAIEALRPKA